MRPKTILDLGCGGCKLSSRFMEKGVEVTGVDKVQQDFHHKNFKFIQKELEEYNFTEKYDAIFTIVALHFLKNKYAQEIIENMKAHTNKEGYNFLVCMSKEEDSLNKHEEYFYTTSSELEKLYRGWDILCNESCFSREHLGDDGTLHKHKIIVFLAKKKN